MILPGESLNLIIEKYYDGSGLNKFFLQLAIVSLNKHAFRNRNINYMIAEEDYSSSKHQSNLKTS